MTVFKLKSNLGIRRLWHGIDCDLAATKSAPTDLQIEGIEFDFSDSRHLVGYSLTDYLSLVARESARARDLLVEQRAGSQIVIGGDHGIAFASVLADLQVCPAPELGILIIDSHDDFNLAAESATGNWHGMWLRPLFTHFDFALLDQLVPAKLPLVNLLYVGNLDVEPATAAWLQANRVQVISGLALQTDFAGSLAKINRFIQRFRHIHLSFDLDSIAGQCDAAVATSGNWAVNLPFSGGMPSDLVSQLFTQLSLPPNFSFDLVEYNATRAQNKAATFTLAHQVLQLIQKQSRF